MVCLDYNPKLFDQGHWEKEKSLNKKCRVLSRPSFNGGKLDSHTWHKSLLLGGISHDSYPCPCVPLSKTLNIFVRAI